MSSAAQSIQLYRQSQLATALQIAGLSALALNPGPSLFYLTGLNFHLMERPVLVIFIPHTPPIIIMPELEAQKVANLQFSVQAFMYGEDPTTWQSVFTQAIHAAGLDRNCQVGVEPRRLRFLELRLIESATNAASIISAEDTISSLRVIKEEREILAMRKAVEIAQRALLNTMPEIKIGTTEKEIAAELTLQLLRAGSDPELPFSPIVSSGPNSANPHATPSNRVLQPGDCLVIDWGAASDGYISDITRTFMIAKADPEMEKIGRIVAQSNAAGRAAAGSDVHAGNVDAAARGVIEESGYGQFFTHRTGHGIGLEAHEEPYIHSGNKLSLKPGMTFTIEPGIYLPNQNGVRIEDNVVITAHGSDSLTDLPRELIVLG